MRLPRIRGVIGVIAANASRPATAEGVTPANLIIHGTPSLSPDTPLEARRRGLELREPKEMGWEQRTNVP